MKIPIKYSLRNLNTRRLTTGLTMVGVALVVFVFAAVLMLAHGLQQAMIATGSDDNVIVLRKAANAEISSIVGREEAAVIKTLPGVQVSSTGKPVASSEVVVVINIPYVGKSGFSNVTVRGVAPEGFALRPQVKLTSGRLFSFGSREIIVGSSIAKRFRGASIGETMKFGGDSWTIVGVFDAGGSGFDSEIWGDVEQLGQAFTRPVFSSITCRLQRTDALAAFNEAFWKDNRLQTLEVKREKQFYEEQSEGMSSFIRILGVAVTIIFSLGAIIGAMITMYAAVANRTVEIGTMRALGFKRRSILGAFLFESMILSLVGGTAGLLLASLLQFVSISMMNYGTFSEMAFGFRISSSIAVSSLLFAIIMGIVGGFFPAVRAARLNIVAALRSP